jgi:hypothetical protein
VSHHGGALDAERIEEGGGIGREVVDAVAGIRAVRIAEAALVRSEGPVAAGQER